jgi:hypothetical protein
MAVFWDFALADMDQCFREAYYLHHTLILMMEAVSSSEMSVSIYQTTQCNIPPRRQPSSVLSLLESEISQKETGFLLFVHFPSFKMLLVTIILRQPVDITNSTICLFL